MTTPPKTTLAILEDDKLVANLLRDFLNAEEEFQVIFIGYSLVEFIEKLKTEPTPDVILMDLKLKDGSGEVLLNHCTKNEIDTKKIIISSHYQPIYIGYMFKLGANAFLPKEIEFVPFEKDQLCCKKFLQSFLPLVCLYFLFLQQDFCPSTIATRNSSEWVALNNIRFIKSS